MSKYVLMTRIKNWDPLEQINLASLKSAKDIYMTLLRTIKYRGKKQKISLKNQNGFEKDRQKTYRKRFMF